MGRAGAAMRYGESLGARQGIHAVDPGSEPRACPPVSLPIAQDQVEELVVISVVQRRELQEREGTDVGGGERVAEEVVAVLEHGLEAVERLDHLGLELGYAALVRRRLAELRFDRVRRSLPGAVEPVDEFLDLARERGRVQRRLRMALVEEAHDVHRLGQDLPVVIEHGHERLPAHALDDAPVVIRDPDGLGFKPLEGERKGDPLDVGRVARPVERDHALPLASRPLLATASTVTAASSTAPVIMKRTSVPRFRSSMPFVIDWITRMPSSAEYAEPRPPNSDVPPITAAAIAFSSTSEPPDDWFTAYSRDAAMIPPAAASVEQSMNTVMRIIATLMPARRAASGLPPTANT